jgi:hypothetical protein
LAFLTTQEQINSLAPPIALKAGGDAIVWFSYPKASSKKYESPIASPTVPQRNVICPEGGIKMLCGRENAGVFDLARPFVWQLAR